MTAAPWLDELVRHIGEREIKGPKHNPLIVDWGRAAGISWWNNDEDAWCAVAVNGVLAETGHTGTRSALARSFLSWGVELLKPTRGAIVVFPRGKSTLYGHVGIVEKVHGNSITIVNGNIGDMVKRSTRKVTEILPGGIRWPADVTPPATTNVTLGSRLIDKGVSGPDVQEWQRRLDNLGYGPFEGTGYFGERTDAETRRFQRDRGLDPVDGIVGPATLREEEIARREGGKAPPVDVKPAKPPPGAAEGATGVGGGGIAVVGAETGNWWMVGIGLAIIVAAIVFLVLRRRGK